ncbi:uncharacterized protein C7orf50 homolog isoform X2 [Dunckerocampus dactyliophorus]|uniref:uncharacterized protein C7orf50 homolog isoform X2 n=1 Tax=Dunckerocampus dactyliophorus TaxID=161453 RepID=UPI002404D258|nr:uncharacterized protein C7orf50 homolog isoform X2 [Dunckerocampus dactyliophorus]
MAKDKSQQKPPKRKALPPADNDVCVQGNKVDPISIPDDNTGMEEKQKKKEKKHKKKQKTQQTETTNQISVPPSDPEGDEDLSPEERRVLERKIKKILKKEKKLLKGDKITLPKTEASAGPTAAKQALDYLTCWADSRADWRFQKIRQTWLLQHMFDSDQVPDDRFTVLLQYIEGLRGGARDTTVKKALELVQESGQEDPNVHQRAQRAREVIQMLS